MPVLRSDRRRSRGVLARAHRMAAVLLGAVLLVTSTAPVSAQTPYDEAPPPPSAPIVPPEPEPTPQPTPTPEPTPDVTTLPLVPLPRPAPDTPGATGTVGGEPVTVTVRDPSARIGVDDPLLALVPTVAVIGDGDRLLLPIGPAGSSLEFAVADVRVLELPGIAALVVSRDEDGSVRPQRGTGGGTGGVTGPLEVEQDGGLAVVVGGLAPGSDARLTLLSASPLGAFRVGRDGTVTADGSIPSGFPLGLHLLQVDAVRADGALVSFGVLVDIVPVVVPDAPAPVPAPAPAPEPAPVPVEEAPVDTAGAPSLTVSLVLALVLLLVVLGLRLLLVRRRAEAEEEADADAPAVPVAAEAASSGARPGLSGTGALGIVVLAAVVVAGAWIVLGGATLTRPRVESMVALVALQWLGLRLLGARPGDADLPPTVGILGAAGGLTLGTGVHLVLDAFFAALPLLSGAPGPHLPLAVTLGTLALAVLLATVTLAARTGPAALRTDAAASRTARDDT